MRDARCDGNAAQKHQTQALLYIRNVFAAFDRQGMPRTDVKHENVELALSVVSKHIALINAKANREGEEKAARSDGRRAQIAVGHPEHDVARQHRARGNRHHSNRPLPPSVNCGIIQGWRYHRLNFWKNCERRGGSWTPQAI